MKEDKLIRFYEKDQISDQPIFLTIRELLLGSSPKITEHFMYNMPMFKYEGKLFCYIRQEKESKTKYIAFYDIAQLNYPNLCDYGRKRVKLFYFQSEKSINFNQISELIQIVIEYRFKDN